MTGHQLKNSILQLAIQGKLVPQDPHDEPASVLLAKIRKEKEQLVKDGKLKKKDLITTPISDDEKPFEIPDSWEWVRFCEVFSVFNGDRGKNYPSKDKLHSDGIPFISALNLNNNTVIKDERLLCLSEEQYDKLNGGKLEKGDNVICIRGSLGKHGVFPFERGAIASSLVIAKNIASSVIPGILDMYLDSQLFFDQIKLYNNGTAQPNLAAKSLENFLFPLPPLAEQHRIVEKIDELMPLVEKYGKAQEELEKLNADLPERLRKSVLQEAIQGKLVPQDPYEEPASALLAKIRKEKEQLVKDGKLKKKDLITSPISDDEKPFEIPESWEWCRLKDIFNVWSARRVHEKDWRSSGVPFYRAREIGKLAQYGTVDNELFIDYALYKEFSNTGYPQANDLMMTAVGTLGKCYVVKEDERFYFKDGSVLCLGNIGNVNPLFVKYLIESPMFVQQYLSESDGTTVATLTMVRMNEYLIPLPPLAEQHRIVEKLEEILKKIDNLK